MLKFHLEIDNLEDLSKVLKKGQIEQWEQDLEDVITLFITKDLDPITKIIFSKYLSLLIYNINNLKQNDENF